MNSMVAEGARL